MNVLQRISHAASILFGIKTKGSDVYGANWVQYLRTGRVTKDEYYQGLVFSCVDVIAKAASAVPFALVKTQTGDRTLVLDEDDTIIEEHDVINLLTRPNKIQTWTDFSYLMYSYFALHGESFLLPNNSVSGRKIVQLFLLNPLYITEERGTNNYQPIKKWRYSGNGVHQEFEPEKLITIIQPNPYNELRGVSPIQMAKYDIESELLGKKWNNKFFENGGTPSGIFKIATQNEENFKRAEAQIKQKYTGLENAFKMFVLNKDSDYKNISPSQKDMDFIKQMEFSEKRLLKIFKVPSIFLGDTEDAKYANAWAAKRIFAETVILPMLTIVFDNLNTFLLPMMKEEGLKLKFKNPIPDDPDYLLKKQDADTKTDTVDLTYMTINEKREAKELPPLKGADVLLAEYLLSKAPAPDPQAGKGLSPALPYLAALLSPTAKDLSPTERFINSRNAYLERQEARYRKKLLVIYRKLVEAIRKGLPEAKDLVTELQIDATMASIYPNTNEWEAAFGDITFDFGKLVINEALQRSAEIFDLPIDFTLSNGQAVAWLQNRIKRTQKDVAQTLYNRAREIVARNLQDKQTDVDKIRSEVAEALNIEQEWRVERIVRTELLTAYSEASHIAFRNSKVVDKIQWITAADERVCPLCGPNDGQIVMLGTKFHSGDDKEPIHPNCRCSTVAYFE